MKSRLLLFCTCFIALVKAQVPYNDYIGAGHDDGIIVTSSSDLSTDFPAKIASGQKTVSGSGLEGKLAEAYRFLAQSTLGYSREDALLVSDIGIENWLDQQLTVDAKSYLEMTNETLDYLIDYKLSHGADSSEISFSAGWLEFRYGWWRKCIEDQDQLRQRVAYALSQILVISDNSDLGGHGWALASYYDVLHQHAFGNYKDLLMAITLHPSMGYYLSHLNNPKEIPEENIHPDQNFAREIMQLFTIGLFQLNLDGSRKLDNDGNPIPSYDNNDIAELANVFTGLGISAVYPDMGDVYFGRGIYGSDMTKSMMMYEEWHQEGQKTILDGYVIPSGQNGMKDIEDAVTYLFNHPNTGPFVSKQLIQRLVKSNPSPSYVQRIATVFGDNGSGIRGDLQAVIKTILMDEEARSCDELSNPHGGKLLEPILRYTQFLRLSKIQSNNGVFINHAYNYQNNTFQHPLSSPTVFNFYSPFYSPAGPIADEGLVAPEFQILNSITVLNYPNHVFSWLNYDYVSDQWEGQEFDSYPTFADLIDLAYDAEVLINDIDLKYVHGNMSQKTRQIIKEAIQDIPTSIDGIKNRIAIALYITLISPDYLYQN